MSLLDLLLARILGVNVVLSTVTLDANGRPPIASKTFVETVVVIEDGPLYVVHVNPAIFVGDIVGSDRMSEICSFAVHVVVAASVVDQLVLDAVDCDVSISHLSFLHLFHLIGVPI
jgi:hypothetical protein